MCILIGCWPCSIKRYTHTDGVKSTQSRQRTCFSFFLCSQKPWINHLNFYCIKEIDYIFPCVCTVLISEDVTASKKQRRHTSRVVLFVLYTLWRHLWSIRDIKQHVSRFPQTAGLVTWPKIFLAGVWRSRSQPQVCVFTFWFNVKVLSILSVSYAVLKCHWDEKIVYLILIFVNYNYEMSKKGVLSFSISNLVPEIFRFLTYVN